MFIIIDIFSYLDILLRLYNASMTCAIAGAAGDEKASGPWKCYVAIFEAPVQLTMYIIMCQFPLQQDLYPKLKAIFPGEEMFCIPFSISILPIFVISMKNNTHKNTANFILIV